MVCCHSLGQPFSKVMPNLILSGLWPMWCWGWRTAAPHSLAPGLFFKLASFSENLKRLLGAPILNPWPLSSSWKWVVQVGYKPEQSNDHHSDLRLEDHDVSQASTSFGRHWRSCIGHWYAANLHMQQSSSTDTYHHYHHYLGYCDIRCPRHLRALSVWVDIPQWLWHIW